MHSRIARCKDAFGASVSAVQILQWCMSLKSENEKGEVSGDPGFKSPDVSIVVE